MSSRTDLSGWIEAVPNVSEGRDEALIDHLRESVTTSGANLLDVHSDRWHNRTVFTIVSRDPSALAESLRSLYRTAATSIDLARHRGAHPRSGAVDVIPIISLDQSTRETSLALAEELAESIADEHHLPVFLYDRASREGRTLPSIRSTGLESVARRMKSGELVPDHGPRTPHPRLGVAIIGVRDLLVAWNVHLATSEVAIAKRISRAIRESSGGLPAVRALGIALGSVAQVSMNIVDYRRTSPLEVLERIESLASEEGTTVVESELVGLIPEGALPQEPERLLIRGFSDEMILEQRLRRLAGTDPGAPTAIRG